MSIFALVDGNNFFAACEKVFCPALANKPVVVLSNNDGNVIARSKEVRTLGVPMGAPYFKWRDFFNLHQVQVFSANHELYSDMSRRLMQSLADFCPDMEIYSIDEAFLRLDGLSHLDLIDYLDQIRKYVQQSLGLPISIGLAPTKTLAKVANHYAKHHTETGVFDLRDRKVQEIILRELPIEKLWGVGAKLKVRLQAMNIDTALQLRDTDLKLVRKRFNIIMERMVQELRGISCLPLEIVQPKQQIMCSRSFSRKVTTLSELEAALSHYAARAGVKLRRQKSLAGGVYVFLHTNYFSEHDAKYANMQSIRLPIATDDTSVIIQFAKRCLRQIFKNHYRYHKVGIMLLDLLPKSYSQHDLFNKNAQDRQRLMATLDEINARYGNGTLFYCAEGIERPWQTRHDYRSPRYTTRWDELPIVKV